MIVDVRNLCKSYKKHEVLKDLSFQIESPKILALVGPNGAGKSTLMNCMMNLISYDSGEITLLGKDNRDPSIFKDVSFLKDNRLLYPYLTGYDHLKYIAIVQNINESRINEVAKEIGILNYMHRKVGTYSLGMKQHLLIAMSILNQPKLILMDEPLNGLDPDSIIKMRLLIKELHEKGTTILISSHTLSEIDQITSDILFLDKGKVIYEDINVYKRLEYQLEFSSNEDLKTFMDILDSSPWKEQYTDHSGVLKVHVEESEVTPFIKLIADSSLEVKKMTNHTIGSEERYNALYKNKDLN